MMPIESNSTKKQSNIKKSVSFRNTQILVWNTYLKLYGLVRFVYDLVNLRTSMCKNENAH